VLAEVQGTMSNLTIWRNGWAVTVQDASGTLSMKPWSGSRDGWQFDSKGNSSIFVVEKELVTRDPVCTQHELSLSFVSEDKAKWWVQDLLTGLSTITEGHPGTGVKARTCCATLANELHGSECEDYVNGRGTLNTFPAKPPVARAEPSANLCGRCWNYYNGGGTGRPCGECKP